MAKKATSPSSKPSSLVDTRVIYCGDCLEQLKKLPDGYMKELNTQTKLLGFLESEDRFRCLCAFFAKKSVSELMETSDDETLFRNVTTVFDLLVERCHGAVSTLARSPIERVFLRSVMLAFLRNSQMLVFMRPFRDAPTNVREYRDQLQNLKKFTSWYQSRHKSVIISEDFLEAEVRSGRMTAEERPNIEKLLCFYHYLPLANAWHVSLQPRFPRLLGTSGTSRPDMLFWLPLRKDRQLVVECDGFIWHSRRESFERDRKKDRALKILGFDVFRFTGREINTDPVMTAHELFSFLDDWKDKKDTCRSTCRRKRG